MQYYGEGPESSESVWEACLQKNVVTIVAAHLIHDQFNCDPIKEVELGSGLMGPIK